jgi:hypothetical protein
LTTKASLQGIVTALRTTLFADHAPIDALKWVGDRHCAENAIVVTADGVSICLLVGIL